MTLTLALEMFRVKQHLSRTSTFSTKTIRLFPLHTRFCPIMQQHPWSEHRNGVNPALISADFNKPSIPRSAPPSPKSSSPSKDVLEVAKYTDMDAHKPSFSMRISPWGTFTSASSPLPDHLTSSLPSTAVRKLQSAARRRDETAEAKAEVHIRKHLEPKMRSRSEKASGVISVAFSQSTAAKVIRERRLSKACNRGGRRCTDL